jgi:hypothetical protein
LHQVLSSIVPETTLAPLPGCSLLFAFHVRHFASCCNRLLWLAVFYHCVLLRQDCSTTSTCNSIIAPRPSLSPISLLYTPLRQQKRQSTRHSRVAMQSPRLQSLAGRFSPANLRSSLRRLSSSSSSSRAYSFESSTTDPMHPAATSTINSIIFRVPSIANLEEERRDYSSELAVLEPRPIVYWGSVEERIGSPLGHC